MNYSEKLKQELKCLAESKSKAKPNELSSIKAQSAVIYRGVEFNFNKPAYDFIKSPENEKWEKRLKKPHSQLKGIKEMQSSNSSDALLMNIFCYPQIKKWKGICDLFKLTEIKDIEFGINPKLLKNGKLEPTPTEIDLVLNDKIICEAKLTESDFTNKSKESVEEYDKFEGGFNKHYLPQTQKEYSNYQLIRNILALEHYSAFYLICDARRPDLVKSFYETVRCINDVSLRNRCNIIFWQDIAKSVGRDLRSYLKISYNL